MEQYAESIGLQLKSISDRIRQAADASFVQYGLTGPQVGYIHYLEDCGGRAAQKELEKMAGVSHPTVVGIIGRLQEKGYVEVTTDERDRRNRIVTLTQKAREANQDLHKKSRELNEELVRGLSGEEKAELLRLLSKLSENLDRTGAQTQETKEVQDTHGRE